MPAWRVARSLDTLLNQYNAACPRRNKASDGSIGNAEHASRDSDHNPWYGPGIVTARDFTHDPANGMDIDEITDQLAATRDFRIKYIIANGMILDSRPGNNPWKWIPYHGTNAHRHHFHLSVMNNATCDDARPWTLPMFHGLVIPTTPPPTNVPQDAAFTKKLQGFLNRYYNLRLAVDGIYGPQTTDAVKRFQRAYGHGLAVDGIAGPATRKAMGL
jgi:hypothetical protein